MAGDPPKTRTFTDLRGHGTVLVVDDEEAVRNTARLALERYGYQVLLAEDGLAGLEQFRRRAADLALVLLDMTMPNVSGEEALEQMRNIAPSVPVLASSGYSEFEAVRHFAHVGGLAFIQKPYTAVQLGRKVKELLQPK